VLLTNAFLLLASLQRVRCELPMELFHFGAEEMPARWRQMLLERFGDGNAASSRLDVRDLRALLHEKGSLSGLTPDMGGSSKYHLKPFALLYSRFQEVLFLDADIVVLRDVACLFSSPEYLKKESSALFWKDLSSPVGLFDASNPIFYLLSLDPPTRKDRGGLIETQDSAILVVDKGTALEPLLLVCWLNSGGHSSDQRQEEKVNEEEEEEEEGWGGRRRSGLAPLVRMLLDGGDKETWHLSWRAWEAFAARENSNSNQKEGENNNSNNNNDNKRDYWTTITTFHFERARPALVSAEPPSGAGGQFCGSTFLHWWHDGVHGGDEFDEFDEFDENATSRRRRRPLLLHATLAKRGPRPDFSKRWRSVKDLGVGADADIIAMRRPPHTKPLHRNHLDEATAAAAAAAAAANDDDDDAAEREDCRWAMDFAELPMVSIDEVLDPDFEDSVIADLRSLHNANLFGDFGIFVGKPSTRAKHY
jgi:hypothetical protein